MKRIEKPIFSTEINNIIEEHKLLWEPWMASADSIQGLANLLKSKGFNNFPAKCNPILNQKPTGNQLTKKVNRSVFSISS